uniref:ABC transporter permease n=1 Tax=Acetatifactor sp. TaxID=1872090 RepID=UPI0040575DA9
MKQSIKSNIQLFTELLKVLLKSKVEYRFNFFMEIFINIFTYTVTYLQIWILVKNFNSICGWDFYELMLLYNFNLFSYGFASTILYHPMRAIEELVRNGDFDGVLMKPMNPFVYMLLRQGYFGFWGLIILGIIVFIIAFQHLQLTFSIGVLLNIIMKLLGAILIQGSIMIFTGALSFKFVRALSVMDVCIYRIREFIHYPISIYQVGIQILLTIIVPYAFVNFYPVEALLGKKDNFLPIWIADCGGIVIGVILIILSYKFFMSYVNKYQSTGS